MCSKVMVDGIADTATAARGAVTGLVGAVLAGGLHTEAHDQLSGLLAQVRAVQASLEFVALAVVREVDVRGSYAEDGALSPGAWARMVTRLAPGEAAGLVRTARVLGSGELPATAGALAAGAISPAHVRAIATGVADAPPGAASLIEAEALAVAAQADPRAVTALMARFRHALDPDAADAAALARYARRGFTLSPLPDGSVHIRGLADEVTGGLLAAAIDAASPLVAGDTRTAAQRRLDALGDIARKYLAGPDAPMSGGGHAHLIITIDHHSFTTTRDTDTNDTGHTGGGSGAGKGTGAGPGGVLSWVGPIASSTARRVGCDADVTYLAVGPDGSAQVVGRETRFFTWAQRKAMIARDGDRCPVPYCDRPIAWSDGHHLHDWFSGGPTTVDNGALPCAAHHTLCHEGGWTLLRQPDGRYLFRHHNGKTIGPEPHPPGHHRPTPHNRQ